MAAEAPWSPAVRGGRLQVDVAEVLTDSKAALQEVLAATPGWSQEAARAASVEQISGALTNLVYRCASPAATSNSTVIVRVFGSGGKLFSQKDERNIFLLASELGLGPKCLVEYANGRVEQFLPGQTTTHETMRQPDISQAIAAAMAVFNGRMLAGLLAAGATAAAGASGVPTANGTGHAASDEVGSGQEQPQPAVYKRILQWYGAAQEVCSEEELAEQGLQDLPAELEMYQARLAALFPSWIGFCHNDLQYGNMLLSSFSPAPQGHTDSGSSSSNSAQRQDQAAPGEAEALDNDTGRDASRQVTVTLIDYEYSTLNDVAFDVANHFCEWAYNYHSDEAHVFHDSWLPSQEQQLHFCRAYATALEQHAADAAVIAGPPTKRRATDAEGGSPTAAAAGGLAASAGLAASLPQRILSAADDVEAVAALLLSKARAHVPLSHLTWGLWGLIQDKVSDVDFDYMSYGRQRIAQWHATKQSVLRADPS